MKTLGLLILAVAVVWAAPADSKKSTMKTPADPSPASATEYATLGGGCFWCVEAVLERIPGVKSVVSGYAGGHIENPTYKTVCRGDTGHAEVVQVEFDPQQISYAQLLDWFWRAHDPTTLNRQGGDVGTQYRSVIFYHDDAQKVVAEKSKREAAQAFPRPIVTDIQPVPKFYPAEGYHQDYFRNNPTYPYCQAVIRPKLEKLDKATRKTP